MKKVAVIGGTGFLGEKLMTNLADEFEVVGTGHTRSSVGIEQVDITNQQQVRAFFEKEKPEVVVHTAAISDPDNCEQNKDACVRVNFEGTKHIADACAEFRSRLIYISTVYVFDGTKGSYQEGDDCNPINTYGKTKQAAENIVLAHPAAAVFRFDILYGYNGPEKRNGFFGQIINGGARVNFDQLRQPLLVDDVAEAVKVVINKDFSGVLHLGGGERISKYDLGVALEAVVRDEPTLVPVPEVKQVARRPKNVTLETAKASALGITFHSVQEGVDLVRQQYNTIVDTVK